jgi:hypothetical protein
VAKSDRRRGSKKSGEALGLEQITQNGEACDHSAANHESYEELFHGNLIEFRRSLIALH